MSNSSLPGLERRLGSRSRRSGLMIGISILTTIGILVAGFTLIFAALDPMLSDFVGPFAQPTQAPTGNALAARGESGDPGPGGAAVEPTEPAAAPEPEPTPEPTPTPQPTAEASPPDDGFEPDYRVTAGQRINFREGPGVDFPAIVGIEPGTELESLNEAQATRNPAADRLSPDRQWLKFRLEDGRAGWIRDIDVAPINP
ncbi:MAG TPA: SH3 domain-containing protein [Thermomicrobiales bacterium]|nr:SH3 domain-containing protein [Thermomicrobiales bacterium]